MSSTPVPLTTTAYALLVLVVPDPVSSRELVRAYNQRFGDVWPRTAALVYEQVRRLIQLELMTVYGSGHGRVIAITDRGRDAIAAWQASPSSAPRIDVELAVRLLSCTDVADLRSDISRVGAWAEARIVRLGDRRDGDPAPLGQAMAVDLLRGIYLSISDWADRSA